MANPLVSLMPEIMAHKGIWQGTYRHIDMEGKTIDFHQSRVECIFPDEGPVVYIQKNEFAWEDGQVHQTEFSGVLEGKRIFWDTETFSGYGWAAGSNIFLLELNRKDLAGASFSECIIMSPNKKERVRTWHWFKDGSCYQRTLCNEKLVTN